MSTAATTSPATPPRKAPSNNLSAQRSNNLSTQPRCKAKRSSDGKPCKGLAMKGQKVCRMHGGSAPQVRAAAKRRLVEETARAEIASLGLSREVDPVTALMESVHEAAGNVAFLRLQVGENGRSNTRTIYDEHGRPYTNPVLEFYNEERDRLARYSKLAIDAGVAERQVRLAEFQAEKLASVFDGALGDIGLDVERRVAAVEAMARRLRSLT